MIAHGKTIWMIMAKKKKIDLDRIPTTLEKICALIDREIDVLTDKPSCTSEEAKNLIAYAGVLSALYKDYRAECLALSKDIKTKSKEDILAIIKAESIS